MKTQDVLSRKLTIRTNRKLLEKTRGSKNNFCPPFFRKYTVMMRIILTANQMNIGVHIMKAHPTKL